MNGKTKIRINVVIQKKNYTLIPEIMELAGTLGAADVRLMPVDGKSADRWNLTKTEIREYNELIAPETLKIREKFGFPIHKSVIYPFGKNKDDVNLSRRSLYALGYYDSHLCYAPWLHTFIAWDGNVYFCCMSRGSMETLGNINSHRLEDIFHGPAYTGRREDFFHARPAFCSHCDDFLIENSFLNEAFSHVNCAPGTPGSETQL